VDVLVELSPEPRVSLGDGVDPRDEPSKRFDRFTDLISEQRLRNPIRRRETLGAARVMYAA
jgi:hypothetical protein